MDLSYPGRELNPASLKDVKILAPDCYNDFRGFYWTVHKNQENEHHYNHDKVTVSKKDVLRGIHGDFETTKMITCVYGEIYCVVVDKRQDSGSYNRWCWSILSHTNRKSVVLPPGVGLGYMILSDEAAVLYKLAYDGDYQDTAEQFTFKWNDPAIGIEWPHTMPILQKRDM